MPDPSHRPYKPMTIIRPNTKPPLWWLLPWSYARTLHTAANALRALTDRQDKALTMQAHIIVDQSEEIANLRRRVEDLTEARQWKTMETAPKNMTKVLGYVEQSVVVMWWFPYDSGRACWETVDGESEVDPTHWMPLPNSPYVKKGGQS